MVRSAEGSMGAYLTDGASGVAVVDVASSLGETPGATTNLSGTYDTGIGVWLAVLLVSTVILFLYLLLKRRAPALPLPSYVIKKQ